MLSYCELFSWEQTSESTDNHINSKKSIWKCRLSIEQWVITALFKGPVCVSSVYTYFIFYIHIMDSVHYFIWIFLFLVPNIYWLDIHCIAHLIIYMVVSHIISYSLTFSKCYIGKMLFFNATLYVYCTLSNVVFHTFLHLKTYQFKIYKMDHLLNTCITLSKNNLYSCIIKCHCYFQFIKSFIDFSMLIVLNNVCSISFYYTLFIKFLPQNNPCIYFFFIIVPDIKYIILPFCWVIPPTKCMWY